MNHIKSFENFNVNEESVFRKFTTGHESKGDEKKAKENLLAKLDEIGSDIERSPEKYAQSKNWEKAKQDIIKKAEENRFRGSIRVQKGGKISKLFVVYDPKLSGLQDVAAGASSRTSNPLGGK